MNQLTAIERTLFRLFAAEIGLYSLAAPEEMQVFLEKLVSMVPGIGAYEVALWDPEKYIPQKIQSRLLGPLTAKQAYFTLADFDYFAEKANKDIYLYPIVTATRFFGFIAIKPCNLEMFKLFTGVISHFAINASTIMENKVQKNEIDLHREHLQQLVSKKTAALQRTKKKLKITADKIIHALAATVESRDPYTSGHQYRVAMLSSAIANKLKLSPKKRHELYLGALIHDIGKIQVPIEILSSPIQLSSLQISYLKIHPEAGWNIIQPFAQSPIILDIILHHHERLDGSGYPHGLHAESIPLTTRIVSVADVFEAMASHRPYRPKYTLKQVFEELQEGAGKCYDKTVVNTCIQLIVNDGFQLPIPAYTQLFERGSLQIAKKGKSA